MTTRVEFVAEARRWIGTRWHHQGRVIGAGVDCAGLLTQTARAVLLLPPATIDELERSIAGYSRIPSGDLMRRICDRYLRKLERTDAQAGDIALLRFERDPQHLGILSAHGDGLGLIHALAWARKVVEHRLDSVWSARVVDYYTGF